MCRSYIFPPGYSWLTCRNQWRGSPWMCAACQVCSHLHSSQLQGLGWEQHIPRICTCKTHRVSKMNVTWNQEITTTASRQSRRSYLPFGQAVGFWIELCGYLAKLGKYLVDDIFELVQTVRAHLRDVVYHHHGINAISLLRLLPQDIVQELCRPEEQADNKQQ